MNKSLREMANANTVRIFTDGSCLGNPGPGGWGAVIECGEAPVATRELSGGAPQTTNNRMELQAAISALASLDALQVPRPRVHCTTDSTYVKDGITKWIAQWERKGWMTARGKPVANQDLWRLLHDLNETHRVEWHWVRGHRGHPQNERADALARAAVPRRQR
jgi:ribonuclease HI